MSLLAPLSFISGQKDKLFQQVFSAIPVFTILFEDTDIEEDYFGVNKSSAILTVTGAGCGVAGHLSKHPERIDAVDMNPHHLALTALKVEAARKLSSHDDLYALFGYGKLSGAREIIQELTKDLPEWIGRYWSKRYKVFNKGLYHSGLFHHVVQRVHILGKIDGKFLGSLKGLPQEEVSKRCTEVYKKTLNFPFVTTIMDSPLLLLAGGINFRQRQRNIVNSESKSVKGMLFELIDDISETDIEKNWIIWHIAGGVFNHEHPEARPPYLRKKNHESSYGSPTKVNYLKQSFLEVMQKSSENHWSHYSFSDAMDWMPADLQRKVLMEVVRTARKDGVFLNRTVEKTCLIRDLGLENHFERMNAESDEATRRERSKLYRRTDLYRIKS